nr:GtrA family protein [Thermoproteota archaeon]
SAILQGIKSSTGKYILVMDADFSHPPETVPLLIKELLRDPNSIVVASRYIRGGSIRGWPYKRLLLSRLAAKIAIHGLKLCNIRDPISGFFAFPRHIIENIRFDTYGYKLLLEILVKAQGVRVKEIPYTFIDRKSGESKFDNRVMLDYVKAVWYLYRYGRKSKPVTAKEEKRRSVLFLSKAARFYSVGATGLLLNYIVSMMLTKGIISNFWYLQASIIGIIVSITSNFFLNKFWTFEDRTFSPRNTLKQYGMFLGLSTVGAVVQLILLYLFVQSGFQYTPSLVLAVAAASVSNFLLNKKWTFREKIWG